MLDINKIKNEKDVNDYVIELFKNLSQSVVKFSYRKKNGDVREANGTIDIDLVLNESDEKYQYLKEVFDLNKGFSLYDDFFNGQYFYYYDTDKKDIRQFSPLHLISI